MNVTTHHELPVTKELVVSFNTKTSNSDAVAVLVKEAGGTGGSFDTARKAVNIASDALTLAKLVPMPDHIKEPMNYTAAAVNLTKQVPALAETVSQVAEATSYLDQAHRVILVANLTRSVVSNVLVLAKPLLPHAFTAAIPGGAVVNGICTGLSLLNTAFTVGKAVNSYLKA